MCILPFGTHSNEANWMRQTADSLMFQHGL